LRHALSSHEKVASVNATSAALDSDEWMAEKNRLNRTPNRIVEHKEALEERLVQ